MALFKDKIKLKKTATEIVIALLRSVLTDKVLDEKFKININDNNLASIYKLAKKHDVAHLVGVALEKNRLLIDDTTAKKVFQKEISLAVFRYEKNMFEQNRVQQFLETNEIEHILLKGPTFRTLYPEPWMRTSADIDILVKESELDKTINLLCDELGYKYEEKHSHDVSLFSSSNVHLELHYNLNSEKKLPEADLMLENVMEKTVAIEGYKYRKDFAPETFYLYHVAHGAKHFINGGCGIKFFIDTWLYKNSCYYNQTAVTPLLKKGNLDLFEQKIDKLIDKWFNGAETDDLTDKIEEYVINGGVYGSEENKVKISQGRNENRGKFRFVWNKIFVKYDIIKYEYPILEKHRWLIFFCQIHRLFKKLFKGRTKSALNQIKINNSITEEQNKETIDFLKEIGLK